MFSLFFVGKVKFPPQIHSAAKPTGVNATGVAVFMILLITIAGGIYIYNFVDTHDVSGEFVAELYLRKGIYSADIPYLGFTFA